MSGSCLLKHHGRCFYWQVWRGIAGLLLVGIAVYCEILVQSWQLTDNLQQVLSVLCIQSKAAAIDAATTPITIIIVVFITAITTTITGWAVAVT